jgi:hypothetical protein
MPGDKAIAHAQRQIHGALPAPVPRVSPPAPLSVGGAPVRVEPAEGVTMSSAEAGTSIGGARGEAIGDSDAAMAGWRMSPRERRFLVWSSPLSYPTFPFISHLVLGRIHVRSSSDLLNCSEAHAGTDESRSAGNMSTAEAEERPAF